MEKEAEEEDYTGWHTNRLSFLPGSSKVDLSGLSYPSLTCVKINAKIGNDMLLDLHRMEWLGKMIQMTM